MKGNEAMDRASKRKRTTKGEQPSIEIKIRRSSTGSRPNSEACSYKLQYREGMTLHSALEEVYKLTDQSLAFRRYRCGKGVCMSCVVSVNGERKQACTTLLMPGECVFVEPDSARPLVRDLVTIPSGNKYTERQKKVSL
jgi:succinate dehydrogenase/fumarate reductase-like Fe-S protein